MRSTAKVRMSVKRQLLVTPTLDARIGQAAVRVGLIESDYLRSLIANGTAHDLGLVSVPEPPARRGRPRKVRS